MKTLEQQITELDIKVNQLYELVERLTSQVTLVLAGRNSSSFAREHSFNSPSPSYPLSLINHQDVLIDDSGENLNSINQDPIEPEVQIKRLTAQLTAAYNRIASLEEQLMSKRTYNNRTY